PARLQVTTSLETLLGLSGAPAAEMDFSLPISSKTVERLACDCSVTRILLGSDSMVIDVGRSKRTVEGPRRTALEVRDRHCRWPGCDRPAKWSAAHHVVHWIQGGSTDLDNLVLLCHRHHWMVHEGKWQLVRAAGGQMLTIPPSTTFAACARAPGSDAAA
ncbi:MAG TPA: HNH endonuclease signature motif containing protein, partial [Candidatus Dormibacteraeota bacterium]